MLDFPKLGKAILGETIATAEVKGMFRFFFPVSDTLLTTSEIPMAVPDRETLIWYFWLCHYGFRASVTLPCRDTTMLVSLPLSTAIHREPPWAWLMDFWKLRALPWKELLASFRFNPSCSHTLSEIPACGKSMCLVNLVSLWVSDDRHLC